MLGMLGNKKDKIGSIIVARMSPQGATEEMGKKAENSDYSSAYDSCCEEIFNFLESGDKKGFLGSMKNLVSMMLDEERMSKEESPD